MTFQSARPWKAAVAPAVPQKRSSAILKRAARAVAVAASVRALRETLECGDGSRGTSGTGMAGSSLPPLLRGELRELPRAARDTALPVTIRVGPRLNRGRLRRRDTYTRFHRRRHHPIPHRTRTGATLLAINRASHLDGARWREQRRDVRDLLWCGRCDAGRCHHARPATITTTKIESASRNSVRCACISLRADAS